MKLAAIDANLVLALHALLQECSVTRAAKRLGIGQPAMSRSLARLRDHFKDPLLVMKGRQLVLSPAAQALLPAVNQATAALADVFRGPARAEEHRNYVVACADLFGAAVVPALVEKLLGRGSSSSARIEVRAMGATSSQQLLEDGVDVVLGSFEDVPSTVGQRHLFSDPFVCVVRADHPRVGASLSLSTYLALHHIEVAPAPKAKPGLRIERALGRKASERRVAVRVPYFSLAARILAESDLVLTMTRSFAHVLGDFAPLKIAPAPVPIPPQRFSLLWHRRYDADAAHERLRDVVSEICVSRLGPEA